MGLLSSLGSFMRAVVDTASQITRTTMQAVREISATVLVWMGETGEVIIGGIKKVWRTVRPYVDHARRALVVIAQHSSMHWIATAAHGLERVLATLTAFEQSPVAHVIDQVLNWMIRKGKELKLRAEREAFTDVDATEVAEAEQSAAALRVVMTQVPVELHADLMPAAILAQMQAVSGKLNGILAGEIASENVEFYLQVRATQKLIRSLQDSVSRGGDAAYLADSYFLASIADELVNQKIDLSPENAARLDAIIFARTGMHFDAFVLEELVPVFAARSAEAQAEWDEQSRAVSKATGRMKVLENSKAYARDQRLQDSEQHELDLLAAEQLNMESELERLDVKRRFAEMCAGASEGLVKMLEQPLESMSADDVDFLHAEVAYIAPLLVRCFKDPDGWSRLNSEERERLVEYAVSYLDAMKARIIKLRA